ncbi:NmrA family NAD(P)-binding protein [Pantoea cypripedii]|uniref:NmrA-like domain-containing protein n=1 Tax=Pantoea cypripedii TaxID=55209 RepID=A0A6B9GH16_PANCY|nr:NmrA family NAD(P)-binding protein [Pantoea cypripedii]QGY32925.1 hypothetical protein CUN67_28755 [Pantoea cypripedii]
MFFISGITGKVGGAAARSLLSRGKSVRALARDLQRAEEWSRLGVEVVQGDLTDVNAVKRCLNGVDGAFLMQPTPFGVTSEFPEAKAINGSLSAALASTDVPRVVILSSIGSEQPSGLGNIMQTHLLEEALATIPIPIATVRAGSFLENYVPSLERAATTGYFDTFLQPTDRPVPMVASEDIGHEVARLLIEGWSGRTIIELGSPYSPDDLACAMAEALSKPVKAKPIPKEYWKQTLQAMGLSTDHVDQWAEMQDGFNSGWIDFGRPGTIPVQAKTKPIDVFSKAVGK